MGVTSRVRVVREQFPEIAGSKVSLNILLLIDNAVTQRLLVLLPLKYLLLYRPGLQMSGSKDNSLYQGKCMRCKVLRSESSKKFNRVYFYLHSIYTLSMRTHFCIYTCN